MNFSAVKMSEKNGKFETNHCEKAGGENEFEWKPIPEGTKVKQESTNKSSIIGTANIRFICTELEFTGEIKVAGGLTGEFKLKRSCKFEEKIGGKFENPKGCKVVEPIAFIIKGEMVNGTVEPVFEFGAKGGKVFTKVKLTKPALALAALNTPLNLRGKVKGRHARPQTVSWVKVLIFSDASRVGQN